jgi:hypothetical protein
MTRSAHVTAQHWTRKKAFKALLSLLVLALLAVTLQSLVYSGASFTATSSNAASVFTAGSLSHTNSQAGLVVLDASCLRPGVSKEGTVTITGGGTLTGAYSLTKGAVVDTSAGGLLSRTLVLLVQEVGAPAPVYQGSISGWTTGIALGAIAPGASRTYLVRLTYPAGAADSALDGTSLSIPLTFAGVSS